MLPFGIEFFKEIRSGDYYYVDKTKLIEEILDRQAEVTIFMRPSMFGKAISLSMLKSFFEPGADKELFEGLYISKNKELTEKYMGKYPVIFSFSFGCGGK